MRSPKDKVEIYTNTDDDIILINQIPYFSIEEYDLFDDNDRKKFIKTLKRNIRGSFEYRAYVSYLRENLEMNKCSFYNNVNNIETFKIKIEIHHEPFTLEDICKIVFNKRIHNNESLEIEMVAKEVMYIHYINLVGLIPLSSTVHELVHNNYLFIPSSKVYGNYKKFVELYHDYLEPEQLDTLDRIEEITRVYDHNENTKLLSKKFIYVDATGAYDIPHVEDITAIMKQRISDIKQSKNDNISNKYDNNLDCPFTINQ